MRLASKAQDELQRDRILSYCAGARAAHVDNAGRLPHTAVPTSLCPFCHVRVSDGTEICSNCGERFPWITHIDQIQGLIKERESNRVRAALTLAEELYGAARGGKPVSVAAIKGFVTALLVPRMVIVAGSVIAGLVLIAQTFILYKQTQFLDIQARAAQIEQEARLRERITPLQALTSHWSVLVSVYEREIFTLNCGKTCHEVDLTFIPPTSALGSAWFVPEAVQGLFAYTSGVQGMQKYVVEDLVRGQFGMKPTYDGDSIRTFATLTANHCGLDPIRATGLADKLQFFGRQTSSVGESLQRGKKDPRGIVDLNEAFDLWDDMVPLNQDTSGRPRRLDVLYELAREGKTYALDAAKTVLSTCNDLLVAERKSLDLMKDDRLSR